MSRTHKDTKRWVDYIADKLNTIPSCIGGVPSWWKKLRKRSRRAKEKDAMRHKQEIPRFKKTDEWDWY